MYTIRKLLAHPTVDFAAEELKKYLRMMLPRAGDIPISYDPSATDGFRLGLMEPLGLDLSDAADPKLDDVIYLSTDACGGVIAGSNPGALLIAVYRYLRAQGCRWLFPGVDGEWIPVCTTLAPVSYRKLADHRYRGQCNEGAEFQSNMIETIDFTPKIGMNTYMLEFDIPRSYYDKYYLHKASTVREPEPITDELILQWKRQCEVEIQKRGLKFHDMGHGWTAEPFGLDSKLREMQENVPQETLDRLALINGKRGIFGSPINTNFCMSNPENRKIVVDYIADYAQTQNNVDFLHIWLADATRNHCECDVCKPKPVADWYLMMLNEADAELTRRGLDTHLVFIVYTETFWPPIETKLKNPSRFTMLYAPIFRKYTETYGETPDASAVKPFSLNKNVNPQGMSACLGYLDAWKKHWKGDCFCYEYHFWRHQYFDPSGMYLARLLYDDITAQRKCGLSGIVEDGSQRSYFPTGFPFYVYGETLYDASVSFETLQEDYFSHAFGEKWRDVVSYLNAVRDALPFAYLSGMMSADETKGRYYNPGIVEGAAGVHELTRAFASVIDANINQPKRPAAVSWQLLKNFGVYADMLAEVVKCKAVGNDQGASDAAERLFDEFSRREIYIERWYDLFLSYYSLRGLFTQN
jgi:hypothetical protein